MDPFTLSLLSDVIANGICSIASSLYRRAASEDRPKLQTSLRSDEEFGVLINKALASVAKDLGTSKAISDRVRLFLISPEVEAIVRQIYSLQVASRPEDMDTARSAFTYDMAFYLSIPVEELEKPANELFKLLTAGVDKSLSVAAGHGSISAHEAISARRQLILLGEIATISRTLEFFSRERGLTQPQVDDFEKKLRAQVLARHSHIMPPHFDSARKIPIDDLYVSPNLLIVTDPKLQQMDQTLPAFLSTMYRMVLLGDPGGGKSTLAQKLCHDLAYKYEDRLLGGRRVTPFIVVLREYGTRKKTAACSILEYLEIVSRSVYQLTPPSGAIEYLLLAGRLVIIFDGLDELLETNYRQQVSADVEVFCQLYPAVPVLITSRKVGYEQAPLDPAKFPVGHLAPFNKDQIADYVHRWFSVETDLREDQKAQKVGSFLKESSIVPDLRSNPLMLALMCNIYRGENYIPQNRPEVYEKCATMLFERWDKSRGINVALPFEAHVRPAMMYIAFWQYSNEEYQAGVTEEALITKASEYLAQWRFADLEEARQAARDFVDFCRGRAWVFTDVGTTKWGDRLYQFTHRTFLEFFTGAYLATLLSKIGSMEKLSIDPSVRPRVS